MLVSLQQCRHVPATSIVIFSSFFVPRIYFPASGQAVVTGVVPSPPRFLPSIFIAHRVQQSHCSSIFYRVLPTHALALSASQFVHKKKSPRIYTSMHSGAFELTKLTYTRLEDNLIRHRGDRLFCSILDIGTIGYSTGTAVTSVPGSSSSAVVPSDFTGRIPATGTTHPAP